MNSIEMDKGNMSQPVTSRSVEDVADLLDGRAVFQRDGARIISSRYDLARTQPLPVGFVRHHLLDMNNERRQISKGYNYISHRRGQWLATMAVTPWFGVSNPSDDIEL